MKTKKWQTIRTLIIIFLKSIIEGCINGTKVKSQPRKTCITEIINLANSGNFSDINEGERERRMENNLYNDKAYPLEESILPTNRQKI